MARPRPPTLRAQRRRDILACAPGIVLQHHGLDTNGQIARHLGLSNTGLRAYVSNEAELIRLLCQTHLNAMFDAVCASTGRSPRPPDPVAAMAQAVLATAADHPARHRVYLHHRFMLKPQTLQALDTLRATIDNSFHFALHAQAPEKPFCALRAPARALVGQLLHTPLWQPTDPPGFVSAWLASQIGFLATCPEAA
jgi:AcrR family transcriptional regulator